MREGAERRQQAKRDQGLCIVCDKKIKNFNPFDEDAIQMCAECEIRTEPRDGYKT